MNPTELFNQEKKENIIALGNDQSLKDLGLKIFS